MGISVLAFQGTATPSTTTSGTNTALQPRLPSPLPLLLTDLSVLYQQIDCIASDHQVRDKRESEGNSPCTDQGEIGIYVFNEIKYCEYVHVTCERIAKTI